MAIDLAREQTITTILSLKHQIRAVTKKLYARKNNYPNCCRRLLGECSGKMLDELVTAHQRELRMKRHKLEMKQA